MYIFYFSDYIYVIFGRVEFLHYNTYFQQIANPGKVWSMQLSSQVSYNGTIDQRCLPGAVIH